MGVQDHSSACGTYSDSAIIDSISEGSAVCSHVLNASQVPDHCGKKKPVADVTGFFIKRECRRDACGPGKVGSRGISEGCRKGWKMQAGRMRSQKSRLHGI